MPMFTTIPCRIKVRRMWRGVCVCANMGHRVLSCLSAFCLPVCPLSAGFEAAVREANASLAGARNGGNMLMATPSEKALLTSLVNRLAALDADALCGHNVSAFDLDVLLHRLEKHKVRR